MPTWAVLHGASVLATAVALVAVGLPLLGGALVLVEAVVVVAVLVARRQR